jgi:hypothetical protein
MQEKEILPKLKTKVWERIFKWMPIETHRHEVVEIIALFRPGPKAKGNRLGFFRVRRENSDEFIAIRTPNVPLFQG